MKKLIKISAVALAFGIMASCKTSQNNMSTVSNASLVNYHAEPDYAYPLADSAFKYSSDVWKNMKLKTEMNDNLKSIMENLNGKATFLQYGDALVISLNRGKVFGISDYTLNENSQDILRRLAFNLQQYPDTYILTVGRTDATGSAEFNKNLAYKRAAVVSNYLAGCGIDKSRLFVDTFGEKFPDFSNKLAKNRDFNRRVDFLILPSNGLRESLSEDN